AQCTDLGDGRLAGGPCPLDGRRRFCDRCGARRLRGADPRDLRTRGLAVLRDGPPVGRRGDRPARYAAHPDHGYRSGAPRADPRDPFRSVPDVSWRQVVVGLLAAGSMAGCSALADEPSEAPQSCGAVYSTQTCLAMIDDAASRSHRTRDDVTAIDIVQFPTRDQNGALITRSGGGFTVRLAFADGTTTETP